MAPYFEEIGTFRKVCIQNLYFVAAEFSFRSFASTSSASKLPLMVVTFFLIGFKETT